MNENPYASPAEIAEETSEEEISKIKSRRMLWGLFWILVSAVLAIIFMLCAGIAVNGFLPPTFANELFFSILRTVSIISIAVTQTIGLFSSCFCPEQLVKRGRFYVMGSVGVLLAAIGLPVLVTDILGFYSYRQFMEVTLSFICIAISVLVWLVFLLLLARGLNSTAGKRLALGLISLFVLVAAGMFVYADMRWEPWREIDKMLQIVGYFAWLGYIIFYAILLETLRRAIRQMLAEGE